MLHAKTLPGSFGDSHIDTNLLVQRSCDTLLVNIHGTFGNMNGTQGKYRRFAENIHAAGYSCALYSSSRIQNPQLLSTDPYVIKQAHFSGKRFDEEVEDARRVLQYVLSKLSEETGIAPADLKVQLIEMNKNDLSSLWICS